MKILFENEQYWVVNKPAGMVSEQENGHGLADRLAAQNGGYAGVIHRLDREVGGLILYAKTPEAAARFSELSRTGSLQKEYLVAVSGKPESEAGELRDLLFYDRSKNKVFVVGKDRRGVKKAVLRYRTITTCLHPEFGEISLVSVTPVTGRTHQIRVQFAARRHPVLGDRRYGGHALPGDCGQKGILLACRRITFPQGEGTQEFFLDPEWASSFFPV